jgi:hypothetical protein
MRSVNYSDYFLVVEVKLCIQVTADKMSYKEKERADKNYSKKKLKTVKTASFFTISRCPNLKSTTPQTQFINLMK